MEVSTQYRTRVFLGIALLAILLSVQPYGKLAHAAGGTTGFFVLTNDNRIAALTEAVVSQPTTPIAVTGLTPGESLVGIDVRPQNSQLYGLGVNATANTATIYKIEPQNGVATAIGTPSQIAFVDGGANPIDLPDPATIGYGFDFNPAVDRIRVVSGSGLNFRLNPNTGGPVDGDLGGAAGSVTGLNPDGPINGGTTGVEGAAYTNNAQNATVTTLYTLDSTTNSLYIQNPPNVGTQASPLAITLNGSPLDFTSPQGFDIGPGVDAPSANAAATGVSYALLTSGGTVGLYRIELSTGVATLIGTPGSLTVRGLAIWAPQPLGTALSANGGTLLRFRLDTAATTTSVSTSGVAAGETLVGIDGRPATGQLFGLGVNASADTATLYLLDPQTGSATAIGTPGQIAFVDAAATPIDLPDPATVGYGFDFNPTVDRIRVTTGSGLNFRLNPITGAAVDSDPGPAGVNPDGPINGLPGGSTGVDGAAYTNNYGQPLTGGTTTLYTLDSTSNSLFIQNPPNAGVQTNVLTVTVSGVSLNFDAANGFDIPPGASVSTSNALASGSGYAVLTVAGVAGLYQINLSSGAASLLSLVGVGAPLSGFVAWSEAPATQLSVTPPTVTEGAGNASVTVTSTGGAPAIVSYTVGGGSATAGSDYTVISGTLLLGGGTISQTLTLPILDDTLVEGDETVELQLLGTAGVTQTLTLTIKDNEYRVYLPLIVK